MLDKILQDMQKSLMNKLKWLNCAFGRAYKLVEHRPDGNKFIYPAMYNGNGEYVSLLPNDNFGNFSWFDIYDPQKITEVVQSLPQYTFSGAIIFWYDLSSIYEDETVMHTEEVKDEIKQEEKIDNDEEEIDRFNIFENMLKKEDTTMNNDSSDLFLQKDENIVKVNKSEDFIDNEMNSIFNNFSEKDEKFVSYYVHIVRENDNIDTICLKYGVSVEKIKEYNNIDQIALGSKIIIPYIVNEAI